MGGNTFGHNITSRIDSKKVPIIVSKLFELLPNNKVGKYKITSAAKDKLTCGDIDILCEPRNSDELEIMLHDIQEKLNPHMQTSLNSTCLSILYNENDNYYQVDFIGVNNLKMADFFYSYSVVGLCLGNWIHKMGLHFGSTGLFIKIDHSLVKHYMSKGEEYKKFSEIKDIVRDEIYLETDPEEICSFFGLNYSVWQKGFETKEDIFKWLIESKYKRKFLETNCRFNYFRKKQAFKDLFEYLDSQDDNLFTKSYPSYDFVIKHFNLEEKIIKILEENYRLRIISKKYNNKLFLSYEFGNRGETLLENNKSFINTVINIEKKFNSKEEFDEWIINANEEDIKDKIINFMEPKIDYNLIKALFENKIEKSWEETLLTLNPLLLKSLYILRKNPKLYYNLINNKSEYENYSVNFITIVYFISLKSYLNVIKSPELSSNISENDTFQLAFFYSIEYLSSQFKLELLEDSIDELFNYSSFNNLLKESLSILRSIKNENIELIDMNNLNIKIDEENKKLIFELVNNIFNSINQSKSIYNNNIENS